MRKEKYVYTPGGRQAFNFDPTELSDKLIEVIFEAKVTPPELLAVLRLTMYRLFRSEKALLSMGELSQLNRDLDES